MPDREESVSFLKIAVVHGFIWRLLHHVQKPDLLTPVSIYQFVLGPNSSPELLKRTAGNDSIPCQKSEHHTQSTASCTADAGMLHVPVGSPVLTFQRSQPVPESSEVKLKPSVSLHQPGGLMQPQTEALAELAPHCQPASAALLDTDQLQPCSPNSHNAAETTLYPQNMTASITASVTADNSLAKRTSSQLSQRIAETLLVLDFYWSMIEENSDTFVVRQLGAWDTFQRSALLTSCNHPVLTRLISKAC